MRTAPLKSLSNEELISKLASEVELPQGVSSSVYGERQGPQQLATGTVLHGKYTIQEVLGTGGSATTYQALASDGRRVAVKVLSLKSVKDWKQLTLFQREAQTLAALNHPGIPKYIDYFEVDTATDRAFCIVQEEANGLSLAQMISRGQRCNTDEATRIATELCGVLAYLQSLHPPVVHRDVKPENIVIEGGAWGGRCFLVDFGGVAAAYNAADISSFASTVVGTYGYMAPEQFRGSAQPASDMYALGATLLFLLSGRPPFAFSQERMRINWRSGPEGDGSAGFNVPSPRWASLLDGLLEPVAEDRLTASQALDILQGRAVQATALTRGSRRQGGNGAGLVSPMTPYEARQMAATQLARNTGLVRKPAGTRVLLDRSPNRLDVTIPPKGFFNADTLMTGSFAVAWNAFVAVWTAGALASGGLLMALFSLPFWFAGIQLGKQSFGSALVKERLAIGLNRFRVGQELALLRDGQADFLGGDNERLIEGLTPDLIGARIVTTMFVNDQPQTAIELIEGVRKHRFGEGLELPEQQWLVSEINQHLESVRGAPVDYDAFPQVEVPRNVRDDNTTSAEP